VSQVIRGRSFSDRHAAYTCIDFGDRNVFSCFEPQASNEGRLTEFNSNSVSIQIRCTANPNQEEYRAYSQELRLISVRVKYFLMHIKGPNCSAELFRF
jgi:hypothetical protein